MKTKDKKVLITETSVLFMKFSINI